MVVVEYNPISFLVMDLSSRMSLTHSLTICCIVSLLHVRYPDFAPMFKAELFDPDHWADVFKRAGAKCALIICILPNYSMSTSCRRCPHL